MGSPRTAEEFLSKGRCLVEQNDGIVGSWLGRSKGGDNAYNLVVTCNFYGCGAYKVVSWRPTYNSSLGFWKPCDTSGHFILATVYAFYRIGYSSDECLDRREGALEVILGAATLTLEEPKLSGEFNSVKLTYPRGVDLANVAKELWKTVQENPGLKGTGDNIVHGDFTAYKIL